MSKIIIPSGKPVFRIVITLDEKGNAEYKIESSSDEKGNAEYKIESSSINPMTKINVGGWIPANLHPAFLGRVFSVLAADAAGKTMQMIAGGRGPDAATTEGTDADTKIQ